ncbi:MAG: hypothetical protein ACREI2_11670 [Nitrospiraceae bacterium]
MHWKMAAAAGGSVVLVICAGMALSNPTLPQYRQSILTPLAELEAEKLAQADRRAIEQEAAKIYAEFASVHYDAHKLDAAILQKNHPLLGAWLPHQNETESRTFPEILALSKQRALSRVDLIRKTVFYEVLTKLTTHTTRTSHGLWSTFATCGAGKALSYTAVAGTFYEQTENNCPVKGPAK